MAGDAVVGALRVVLGMDSAAFEDGARKAASQIDKFGGALTKSIAKITAFAASFTLVTATISKAIELGDKLSKASERFGIPGDRLLLLSSAAAVADVSLEQLGSSLSKLSRTMVEVAAGGATPAASAFRALGISVTDTQGRLKTNEQVLLEVADAFSKFEGAEVKAALATAIFKKGGDALIPFLNQGSAGIKKFTDEMERQGLVVAPATLKSAEALRDATQHLANSFVIATLRLLGSSGYIDAMLQSVKATQELVGVMARLDEVGVKFPTTWRGVQTAIEAVTIAQLALISPSLAVQRILGGTAIKNVKDIWTDAHPAVTALTAAMEEYLGVLGKISIAPPIFDPEAAKKLEAFQKRLEGIKAETLETSGTFRDSLAPGFLQAANSLEILKGQVTGLDSGFVVLGARAAQLNDALFKLRGAQLTQESLAPWDQLGLKLQEIENLYNRGAISAETYRTLSLKTSAEIAHSWGEAASSIVSPMADAFKTLASMNKKYAGAAKALAIAEAIVNTYLAATKALASGFPPFNYIAAAAVTAAGLANVAKISATEFAQGGSFKVGGAGGIDSQLITMAMTPGEMVDVRKPGQDRGTTTEVTVNMRGRDIFTGDAVRDLFAAINQGTSDGYRIKMAEG